MTLSEGGEFPKGVELAYVPYNKDNADSCGFPVPLKLDDYRNKKVVIVAVPGAFTPTCSEKHIPAFVENAKQLHQKGADEVIITSSNDPFVLEGWAKALHGFNDELKFASDPLAKFAQSEGLSQDLSAKGLGVRSKRYALIVDHGKVTYLGVEPGGEVTVSGYDAVQSKL